ncbi:MAG: hypothetical protein J5I98_09935 [Phaeodactylibacter sp.]|nr:hypothetical protein [Phaeodactylibacter sp.]
MSKERKLLSGKKRLHAIGLSTVSIYAAFAEEIHPPLVYIFPHEVDEGFVGAVTVFSGKGVHHVAEIVMIGFRVRLNRIIKIKK